MKLKEKQTNFIDILKAFWIADEVETSIDDAIENSVGLTAEEKQLLKSTSQHTRQLERDLQTHEIEKRTTKKHDNLSSKSSKQTAPKTIEYKEENIEREER